VTIHNLAGDLADRVPGLAADCRLNRVEVITNLLRNFFSESCASAESGVRACPFCGVGGAFWRVDLGDADEAVRYVVRCAVCGAQGPGSSVPGLAVFEWNRRRSAACAGKESGGHA
jgi:hypothetical protein